MENTERPATGCPAIGETLNALPDRTIARRSRTVLILKAASWLLLASCATARDTSTIIHPFDEAGIVAVTGNLYTFFDAQDLALSRLDPKRFVISADTSPNSQAYVSTDGAVSFPQAGNLMVPTVWSGRIRRLNLFGTRTSVCYDSYATHSPPRYAIVTTLTPGDYSVMDLPSDEFPEGDGAAYGGFQIHSVNGTPSSPMRNAYRPELFEYGSVSGRDIRVAGVAFLSNGNLAILSENRRGGAGLGEEYEGITTSVVSLSLFSGETGAPQGPPFPVSPPVERNAESVSGLVTAAERMVVRYSQDGAFLAFLDLQGIPIRAPVEIAELFLEAPNAMGNRPPKYPELGVPEPGGPGVAESIASDGVDTIYVTHLFANVDENGVPTGSQHLAVIRFTKEGELIDFTQVDDGANHPAEGELSRFGRSSVSASPDGRFFVCWDPGRPGRGQFEEHRPIVGRFFEPDGTPWTPAFVVYDGDSNLLDDEEGFLCKNPLCAFNGDVVAVFARVDDLSGEIPQARLLRAPSVAVEDWFLGTPSGE